MEGSRKEEFNYDESGKAGGVKDEEDDEETRAATRREEMRMRQEELTRRVEGKDFLSRLLIERDEAEQEETILRAQEARELRCPQTQQTQKLGEELLRIKIEDTREQKGRQLLRKDSIEVRRLEDQLRTAYATKDARLQLSDREIRRENERIREIEEARAIQAWYQNDKSEEKRLREARRKRDEYRRDLQDQLVLNHRMRQRNAEETRRERKLVEEVVEILRAEELENQRRKRETASRLWTEERSFLEARELWKLTEKQVLLKEHDDCGRIMSEKMAVGERSDEARAAKTSAREVSLEKIVTRILDEESRRREREEAPNELMICERTIDAEDRSGRVAAERRLAARALLEEAALGKIAIEERRAKEVEDDRVFAGRLEDDRRKSLIEEARRADERRAIGIDYGKTLREAIENNAIRYREEIVEKQGALKLNRKIDETRRMFIEEERLRILDVHEQRLRGFLKPGLSHSGEVAESANGATSSFRDQKQSFESPSKL